MNKEQAINILNQATMNYSGTREDHRLIVQALEYIKNLKECECPPVPTEE